MSNLLTIGGNYETYKSNKFNYINIFNVSN